MGQQGWWEGGSDPPLTWLGWEPGRDSRDLGSFPRMQTMLTLLAWLNQDLLNLKNLEPQNVRWRAPEASPSQSCSFYKGGHQGPKTVQRGLP